MQTTQAAGCQDSAGMSNSHDGWDQRWLALSRSTFWRSVFFATAMVGLIGLSTPGKTPITLAEGSSLLLADFENETGKPELASHLTQLLHLSLDLRAPVAHNKDHPKEGRQHGQGDQGYTNDEIIIHWIGG